MKRRITDKQFIKASISISICFGLITTIFSTTVISEYKRFDDPPVHNIDKNTYYWTIQEAVDDAEPSNTIYVRNGFYYENVVIDKSLTLTGEDKENTIIDGSGIGNVVNISADRVTIEGFTIQNAGSNYDIDWGSGFGLYDFADAGIYVLSNNSHILGNIIKDNPIHNIHIHDYSDNNVISNNIVTNIPGNMDNGIFLQFASFNIISENIIINNSRHGIHLLQNCNNNIISDNTINDNNCALEISGNWPSNNNMILRNTIKNNRNLGIYLYIQCYNTVISENVIKNNSQVGIVVYQICDNSNILDNIIKNHEVGISVETWTDNITISGNTITNHIVSGIELRDYIDLSTISRNIIENNTNGIRIEDSDNNMFYENTIKNNQRGIYSKYVFSGTLFYHNNFINNVENVDTYLGSNLWDSGYPSGGNFWDDYSGMDNFKGPDQDIPGFDGIGDKPYNISSGNDQDRYPLMHLFVLGDMNVDGVVSWRDIDPFVAAISGEDVFYSQYPDGYWLHADCNHDDVVNWRDIDPFVTLLE